MPLIHWKSYCGRKSAQIMAEKPLSVSSATKACLISTDIAFEANNKVALPKTLSLLINTALCVTRSQSPCFDEWNTGFHKILRISIQKQRIRRESPCHLQICMPQQIIRTSFTQFIKKVEGLALLTLF